MSSQVRSSMGSCPPETAVSDARNSDGFLKRPKKEEEVPISGHIALRASRRFWEAASASRAWSGLTSLRGTFERAVLDAMGDRRPGRFGDWLALLSQERATQMRRSFRRVCKSLHLRAV